MMMHRLWIAITVVLLTWGISSAGVMVDLDHANFRANDSLGYVEVFASVLRSHLTYVETSDSLHAEFMLELDVMQDTIVALSDTFRAVDVVAKDEPPSEGQFFPHVFRFIMKPGTYALRASLIQDSTRPRDVGTDTVIVRVFTENTLSLSDVELGCRMEKTDGPSPFAKNGILMLPNPSGFYGTDLPLFYFYAEAYGLDFDSSSVDSYAVVHRVLSSENGGIARPETRRVYRTLGRSVVIADGFPVSTLRTGTYELELEVISLASARTTKTRKKFWTYRRDDFLAGRTVEPSREYQARLFASAPDVLDVMDPDSALQLMKYVLTSEQWKQALRYNAEGKRQFLQSFWSQREIIDPGATNRHYARVAEADNRWNYLSRRGWKTDRGRVYILYGEPDLMDRNYADPSIIDHEVWHYDRLEGGVIFVFSDTKGFGDLELVHSTKRGEINNPSWSTMETNSRPREGFR